MSNQPISKHQHLADALRIARPPFTSQDAIDAFTSPAMVNSAQALREADAILNRTVAKQSLLNRVLCRMGVARVAYEFETKKKKGKA